jgi:hypothetical protein
MATDKLPFEHTPKGPRNLLATLTFFFGLCMFFGGLLISVIQTRYTWFYLQAVFANAGADALKAVMQRIPAWSRRYMVDLAVIAPGLVCFTGGCVWVGAWRILRGKPVSATHDTFPFPRPYRTYYIQHGLLGAVFGFVIGFWNLDPANGQASAVLLTALGAALWSTLAAIGLAYFLCPIIEWFFQRVLLATSGSVNEEDPLIELDMRANDAASALQKLAEAASASESALAVRSLNEAVMSLSRGLTLASSKLQLAEGNIQVLERRLTDATSEITSLRTTQKENVGLIRNLETKSKTLEDKLQAAEARINNEVEPLRTQVQAMAAEAKDRKKRQDELSRVVRTGAAFIQKLEEVLNQ